MTNAAFMKLKVRDDFGESINGLHANLLLNQFLFYNENKEIIFLGKNELIQIIKTDLSTTLILSHNNIFFNLSMQLIKQHLVLSFIPSNFICNTDLMFSYALLLAINFEIEQFYIGPVKRISSKSFFNSDSDNTHSISLKFNYADLTKTVHSIVSNAQVQECYFFEYQNDEWYGDSYLLSVQEIIEKIEKRMSNNLYVKCEGTYFFMGICVNTENKELIMQISNAFFPWKQERIFSGPDVVFDYWRYLDLLASICQGLDFVELSLDPR
ncbi:MAG: hypothetical protein ACOYT8_00565 [Candidatus Dependentiae bacterium]